MIETKITGFVCKKTDYQDNDAIFNVLTPEGKETFKARGILKITSKNAPNCNYFMVSEFLLQSKSEISNKTLKSCQSVKLYKKPYEDLLVSSSYLFICSVLDSVSEQINGYEMALKCFDMLEEGNSPINVLNYFLKYLLIALGYESNLKSCIVCGKRNLMVSFDISSGGFICEKCFDPKLHEKMPSAFLKDVYQFLKNEEYTELELSRAVKLFHLYVSFLKDNERINVKAADFVINCL